MRVRRVVSAVVLAVLVAGGLSACQSKIGLAAAVNTVRLTDSDLTSYVKPGTAPYVDSNQTTVVPKLFVLEVWIRTELVRRAIDAHGGPLTSAETSAARAYLLGSGHTIRDAEVQYNKLGYENKTGDLILDESVSLLVLIQRLAPGTSLASAATALSNSQTSTIIVSSIVKTDPKVIVGQRYGTWDDQTLSLSAQSTAGLPSFVLQPSASAAQ